MIITSTYDSPLGEILLAQKETAIIGCWFVGQKYFPVFREETLEAQTETMLLAKHWLDDYFAGKKPDITVLPLAPEGSGFRQAVWQELTRIPYGEVTTYGAIAAAVAQKMGKESMSAQAVGGAVGHNPISVIIPCHRVVGSDGSLTGYAGGLRRKQALLQLEKE